MKTILKKAIYPMLFNLQLFAESYETSLNTTGSDELSVEMKTFYDNVLIDNAEPELVHNQFGQKRPIPKNGGKVIEFRKYDPYPKATKALTEGVTPEGRTLEAKGVTCEVQQYGDYTLISDMLILTAIDNNIVEATKLHGSQAGRTLDTITREVLNECKTVQYADESVSAMSSLVGGQASGNHYMSVDCIKRGVRTLKRHNAPKINGYYVSIIHPDVSYDLTNDPAWIEVHKYSNTEEIYEGEIGRIAGVRFVETTEAKIFEKKGAEYTADDGTTARRDVYSTLLIGANAYGVTEITGGGLQTFVKQLGSAGTADPLNQRATVGWKATAAAVILVETNMLRIATTSTYTAPTTSNT